MTKKTFKCPKVERKESFPYGARLDRYDYWRLVMPGEIIIEGDEVNCTEPRPNAIARWLPRIGGFGDKHDPKYQVAHRRRVTKGARK